jgi:hypothetical protein
MTIEFDQLDETSFDRLREALRREFHRAGHGSIKRVLANLGLKRAAFDQAMARRSLKLIWLLGILRELEVDAGRFFLSVFPPEIEMKEPQGRPPLAVQVALDRMKKERWFDD